MAKLFLASNFFLVSQKVAEILQSKPHGKKVLYIVTAAEGEGGDLSWLEDDRDALRQMGLVTVDYTIAGKTIDDFHKDFQGVEYVCVSGGNTFYLLQHAQQSGFIPFIREYIQKENVVYIGSSAGSVIAGADIYPVLHLDDISRAPELDGYKGFGFIDLCILPHWGSENFKNLFLDYGFAHVYDEQYKLVFLTNNQLLYVKPDGSYVFLEV